MEIKGVAILSQQSYAKKHFGEDGFNKWLETLSPAAQEVFSGVVLPSAWYSLKKIMVEPEIKMSEMFFDGDVAKCSWQVGKLSAEESLTGVYRWFVKVGSPAFIIKKATSILPTFFRPSELKVVESSDKHVIIQIVKFDEMDIAVENRICGWMETALEICGCSNIKIEITKSLTKGADVSEFSITWDNG